MQTPLVNEDGEVQRRSTPQEKKKTALKVISAFCLGAAVVALVARHAGPMGKNQPSQTDLHDSPWIKEIEAAWGTDKMKNYFADDVDYVWFTKETGKVSSTSGYDDFAKVVATFMKVLNKDTSYKSRFAYGDRAANIGVAEWQNTEFGTCSDTLFLNDDKKVRKVITVCQNCPADFSSFCQTGQTASDLHEIPVVRNTIKGIEANWGAEKMRDIWTHDAEIVWFTEQTGGINIAVGYNDFAKVVKGFLTVFSEDETFKSGFAYGDKANAGVAAWQSDDFGSCSDTLILNDEGKARKCVTVCQKCPTAFRDFCN